MATKKKAPKDEAPAALVTVLAVKGFHACENPIDVLTYYDPGESRFATVELSGEFSRHAEDSKIDATKTTIKAEIGIHEIVSKSIAWVLAHCTPANAEHATGVSSASSATGVSSVSSATGIAADALNTGLRGKSRAGEGGAIVICNHDDEGALRHIFSGKVGENGIKPDTFYTLGDDGVPQEVA